MSTPRGHGGADGQRAGVEERAVAEVLDQVVALDERRHADPLGALVAHRREPGDVADALRLHQGDHRVAPDAAADERPLGHPRRQVVRAAAAVERRAVDRQRDPRGRLLARAAGAGRPRRGGRRGAGAAARAGGRRRACRCPARAGRRSRRGGRRPSGARPSRTSRSSRAARASGSSPRSTSTSARPWAKSRICCSSTGTGISRWNRRIAGAAQVVVAAQAEQAERLAQLVVRVAAGGDADPVALGRHRHPVEAVGDAVAAGELGADLLELALHLQRVRRQQPAARVGHEQLAVELHRRRHGLDPVGVHVDGAGAVGDRA